MSTLFATTTASRRRLGTFDHDLRPMRFVDAKKMVDWFSDEGMKWMKKIPKTEDPVQDYTDGNYGVAEAMLVLFGKHKETTSEFKTGESARVAFAAAYKKLLGDNRDAAMLL